MRGIALRIGLAALLLVAACGSDDNGGGAAGLREGVLLAPEGNRLHAFALAEPSRNQVVVPSNADAPGIGRDINGQLCITPDGRYFIGGEDTGQPAIVAGWGVFEIHGSHVGELSATQVGKLTPTYQPAESGNNDEPYGCAFLSDGRLITTDVGNQAAGPPSGQVILWFDPLSDNPTYCKLDVAFGTAGGIYVDENDRVYVASARETAGVVRFSPPFPTSNTAAGGCGGTDETGAPVATAVQRDQFIGANAAHIPTPNGVVRTPQGTFLVSSILNGVIAEYSANGTFLRRILEPPPGEELGPVPYSTGSPLGVTVDRSGTVYFADLGLVFTGTRIGPGTRTGSVRRIRFVGNEPQAPDTFLSMLSFPDGVAVWEP